MKIAGLKPDTDYLLSESRRPSAVSGLLAILVDEWNRSHPVGTAVYAEPGVKASAGGRVLRTRTRTPAWVIPSGHAVVSVEGYPGGIALTHVTPIAADLDTED